MIGRGHRRGQNGNAVMEFALIMFPFFALIFGIMSVAYMIFLQGVLTNAVRAGCRWAVAFNRTSYTDDSGTVYQCASEQDACIKAVVQHNAFGFLGGSATDPQYQYIVINYYAPFALGTPINPNSPGFPITSIDPKFSDVTVLNQTNNVIQVTVTGFPAPWLAPFPGFINQQVFNLYASSSDVLEGYGVDMTGDANNGQAYLAPPGAGPPY